MIKMPARPYLQAALRRYSQLLAGASWMGEYGSLAEAAIFVSFGSQRLLQEVTWEDYSRHTEADPKLDDLLALQLRLIFSMWA